MKQTANYKLNKPEVTDVVNIDDLNNNFDTLDAEVFKKVNKVSGKDLSSNDYTTAEKNKLAGIASGANNYSHPSTHPWSMITGAPTSYPANGGNASTVGGVAVASAGNIINRIPVIAADGAMEVGSYMDFHNGNDGVDCHTRLHISPEDKHLYINGARIETWNMISVSWVGIIAYIDEHISNTSSDINVHGKVRIGNCLDFPQGYTTDNDFYFEYYKISSLWWRAVAYDVRSNRVYTLTKMNGGTPVWDRVLTHGESFSDLNVMISYGLTNMNIDIVRGNWTANIGDFYTGVGTRPTTNHFNLMQWESGHFLTQFATLSSGWAQFWLRTKYTSDVNWGAWHSFGCGNSVSSTAPAYPQAGSLWTW